MVLNNQKVSLLLLTEKSQENSEIAINSIIKNYSNFFQINFISFNPQRKYFSEFQRFNALRKHIDFSSDILFTRSPLIIFFSVFKKQSIIYEAHNSYFAKQKQLNYVYNIFFRRMFKSSYLKLFISISDNLNNFWLKKGLPQSKALALHDGTTIIGSNDLPQIDLPFNNSNLLVTYTGSLYVDRGLERIIKLARDFKNLNFLIVGGPIENSVKFREECQLENINNILFTGPVPHHTVASYLEKSDILLALWSKKVPTINYCSPLKVFEYMASNKLIIADGFITIKEVLIHNTNSLLVIPDDYESLKENLRKVIKDKSLLQLGHNNSKLIKEKYTWKVRSFKMLERLLCI